MKTRVVKVGHIGVGGDNPVRIQSMTTSDTRDIKATVNQILELYEAGCEIVRVTVQGIKEADACEEIKNQLIRKGCPIPLAADIHFFPKAAMRVVDFADKVRINPGNFVDKRASFKILEYDDVMYASELERLEEKFSPLVEKCKRLGRAMRIGTNHGSLSDRIMNRFGDTPVGMVEAAFEFARVCRYLDFHDLIFSMKASNPLVMIEAYRLLVARMEELGWDYPLHLGVTEAGAGEDGRVKSAIGIGALLLDGIGDTIRVSLTEDPVHEVEPCRQLIHFANEKREESGVVQRARISSSLKPPVVLAVSKEEIEHPDFFLHLGCGRELGRPVLTEESVDCLITKEEHPRLEMLKQGGIEVKKEGDFFTVETLSSARQFFQTAPSKSVILRYCGSEDVVIRAAATIGSLLCDGCGEGIFLDVDLPLPKRRSLSFAILQGARIRSSKTEFISCPSCGRTLFDLQTVADKIRAKTGHLPGVKIAIMGCIVNGPGEMADADFGYVGSRPGKIDLYVGKECVEKNIDMDEAEDRLVELIKAHGRWVEKGKTDGCTSQK
ncbi:MAG: 4-hydroxy-3-methylbut-2-en-1-yl diphosphate synthase (ferredoxin) [Chlamydiales bacterium]|nr:4-hydroxy-3-methylbut-2-en-1-yl diphosphate synthase (ferredoxin) [Chlamydiales bacterium]MCH9620130.1 4-hydroxy-3-methylbut-2-en-1-yl diphosphate synthase (ferredoxin) [Chlamydiales bacterium]MCH9623600.1 4-hydroxy-3-methylbut-2-en-1-yl diphosphate synthase (ferredoxin) [Chlamydiales bacterium]